MDSLLFHPKVVHVPVALAVLMPLIAGGVALAVWRDWIDRRAWLGVVLLQAVLVGSGGLAMNTGEREEERVERIVPETYIEAHEEAAEAFVWAAAGVLLVMALPLALPDSRARRAALLAGFLGSLVVFGFGYRAGEAGGALVYQHGAAQAYSVGTTDAPPSDEADSDTD
jgi:uncharacterized membrane protein